jgi:acetylornithine deacetylase/succinyl-diaminopimelate desuccinylase-like protein
LKPQILYRLFALSLLMAGQLALSETAPAAVSAQNKATARLPQISDEQYDNAVKILSQYIKIDTTNPPGNETQGARYLADILKAKGIEAELFETAPGRSIVYGRLRGSNKKKALVLLSHIDVVPAQAGDWKYPPFGGEIHDGELWGRGAIDMKGMGVIELSALLALKQSGVKLDRDIIFLATPDEEIGGIYGAKWMAEHKKDLLADAQYLINEGFSIDSYSGGKPKYWGVDFAEKSVLWLGLTANGLAGHASMPMADSANNRLLAALGRLAKNPPKMTLLPPVKEFFKSIAGTEASPLKELYSTIDSSVANNEPGLAADKLKASMLRNTVSITVLKAGYKTNVIPAQSYAELDCRLLPGVEGPDFVEQVKKILDDPTIDVKILEWEKAVPSPFSGEMVEAIKKINKEEYGSAGGVPVVPVVVPWFTDSHWFRELGIESYGFMPFEIDAEHLASMHGKDERLPLAAYRRGINRMYRLLLELAQAK